MGEVVELENVENVCRLCLSRDEPRSSVFGLQNSPVSLASKIQTCLSIQISVSDKLSTRICAQCVKNVNQWHNYKEDCLKSQLKLQQWLENQMQSIPRVVTVKDEPIDLDFDENNVEVISDLSDMQVTHLNSVNGCLSGNLLEDSIEEEHNILNNNHSMPQANSVDLSRGPPQLEKGFYFGPVKTEARVDYDTDGTIEIESASGSELISSPLANKEDSVMEADSTQKANTINNSSGKKKVKRGRHTHYRGSRAYRRKCKHCQINLHSKTSYATHMKTNHSNEISGIPDAIQSSCDEESIEDVEDELVTLDNEAPLTPLQENIIGQLKTYSCYTCRQNFTDRSTTLTHIRSHIPDFKRYTCTACLTEFADRNLYSQHCRSSIECAMKIALVIPKYGEEKYFTCNMCMRNMKDRKELLRHLSGHSDKQYEALVSPTRSPPKLVPMTSIQPRRETSVEESSIRKTPIVGPYMNGDPMYNHPCDLCGMIYKNKRNMMKHRELCLRLAPVVRTSYRCVDCSMTFLVFKKFHVHVTSEHKKKEFTCDKCDIVFKSASDFFNHHETHRKSEIPQSNNITTSPRSLSRSIQDWDMFEAEINTRKTPSQKFRCALCSQEFSTKGELTEHRNTHLKVKIYSCVICRKMFESANALEIHMKDHGIHDSSKRNASCIEYERLDSSLPKTESPKNTAMLDISADSSYCKFCGKGFACRANARRHERNLHSNITSQTECTICSSTFGSPAECASHVKEEHQHPARNIHKCPHCEKEFIFPSHLTIHIGMAHKTEGPYQCDICKKEFVTEPLMKIHIASHSGKTHNSIKSSSRVEDKPRIPTTQVQAPSATTERPAKARKSFPNPPPPKPVGNLQCQVCDDKFTNVSDLRNHLWDVHCASSKPEKLFAESELQCKICTQVFPDKEALEVHVQCHNVNPVTTQIPKLPVTCELCGKHYSSRKTLNRHKKNHQPNAVASIKFQTIAKKPMATQLMCTICRKVFSSSKFLQRHRINFHGDTSTLSQQKKIIPKERTDSISEPKSKRMKFETNDTGVENVATNSANIQKPVMCHPCKQTFPNMSVLYRHKQQAHKHSSLKSRLPVPEPRTESPSTYVLQPVLAPDGTATCNICDRSFENINCLRRHFGHKHKPPITTRQRKAKSPEIEIKERKPKYTNVLLCCTLCDRHVFTRDAMSEHIALLHNVVYDTTIDRNCHREVDLTTYAVEGIDFKKGIKDCPYCHITYPNYRALKIHYFKFHEGTD